MNRHEHDKVSCEFDGEGICSGNRRAVILFAIIMAAVSAWFYGYHNHKSLDNIPSTEQMMLYLEEKGEDYALDKLAGYTRDDLIEIWGEPDFSYFGRNGDIWGPEDRYVSVCFDAENCVMEISLHDSSDK